MLHRLVQPYQDLDRLIASIPPSIGLLALRLALALPFWRSGLTKWDGWFSLSSGARYLFVQEFKLHIFGQALAYPFPLTAAFLAGIGELVLPVLLILGLGTRFAALGILLMTLVIQLTIPDGLINFHLPWAAMALGLMAFGGGRLSLDALAGGLRRRQAPAHQTMG
ncbi:DoxX family protein [Devosia beringensis]|uniref:DoxX family protein n=1 Tax=Devosia beringensis TaxID=2657486 RepID=UPI00186BB03A|nr:DoxX family protein [Devosia beringensis]